MKLIIVHYHFRPGGIRRVIELATPCLLSAMPNVSKVVLAGGEAKDQRWNGFFAQILKPLPVEFFLDPALGYFSERRQSPSQLGRNISKAVDQLLDLDPTGGCLVWAHNLAIGRNLRLSHELAHVCEQRGIRLLSHHHDLWFDNRWLRWPEMRLSGFRTLRSVAGAAFPNSSQVRHAAINREDAAVLEQAFRGRPAWIPNLAEPGVMPAALRVRKASRWLQHKLGEHRAPVWILPCRLLRRKNVAEALLITRWLRPEAWLVTTGGASSADELPYFEKLTSAAHQHHWRLRLGVLQGDETGKPSVNELIAASEAVLLTSIQEGFGLPYLEAAAARRPLIARALPNIAPDLKRFGFRFPQYYKEVLVHPSLFNWDEEQARQSKAFRAWKQQLPKVCRSWAGKPALLAAKNPRPVPFSRLTLTAQLEVLAQPASHSWELCAKLNPFLTRWRRRASSGALHTSPWPKAAHRWLGGQAYAKQFQQIAFCECDPHSHASSTHIQERFIREKLGDDHLFPLLWNRDS